MLKFNTVDFYRASTDLQEFQTMTNYGHLNAAGRGDLLTASNREHLGKLAARLRDHLTVLGANVTVKAAVRLVNILQNEKVTWDSVADMIGQLDLRLEDELHTKHLLVLDPREEALFNPQQPLFGLDVESKFRSEGAFEIDEAAKCMSLGRHTAAVFHMMRIMEIGIRAMARCLQVPDPVKPAERNWGIILKKMKDAMDGKWPTMAARITGDGALFENLYASLDAVKNPWRNDTMHVERKYTDEEARHIFEVVRGFMTNLALRCDENGDPKVS